MSHADQFPEEDFLKHALRVISGWIGNGALKVTQATKITLDWGFEQTHQHSWVSLNADGVTQILRSWEAREEEETQSDIQFHTCRAKKHTSQTHVLHYSRRSRALQTSSSSKRSVMRRLVNGEVSDDSHDKAQFALKIWPMRSEIKPKLVPVLTGVSW